MSTKLKVGVQAEPEFELPPDYPAEADQLGLARYFYRREHFPVEWWELVELALCGCPVEPLVAFRKGLIGRGNPLTAKQADGAISGALKAAGVDCPASWAKSKREPLNTRVTYPEGLAGRLSRARYFLKNDRPVIFARPQGYKYAIDERLIITDTLASDVPLSFLEWDDTAVDRVAAPNGTLPILMPKLSNPKEV